MVLATSTAISVLATGFTNLRFKVLDYISRLICGDADETSAKAEHERAHRVISKKLQLPLRRFHFFLYLITSARLLNQIAPPFYFRTVDQQLGSVLGSPEIMGLNLQIPRTLGSVGGIGRE